MFNLDENTDLLNIKEIIKDHYLLANFAQQEHELTTKQIQSKWLLYNKHYTYLIKLITISIDGFKSDRYINKIKDMTENIERASKQLMDEETYIQKGTLPPEEVEQSLDRITNYLLRVETFIQEKAVLTDKLELKKEKWQASDSKFRERKQTLFDLIQIGVTNLTA